MNLYCWQNKNKETKEIRKQMYMYESTLFVLFASKMLTISHACYMTKNLYIMNKDDTLQYLE